MKQLTIIVLLLAALIYLLGRSGHVIHVTLPSQTDVGVPVQGASPGSQAVVPPVQGTPPGSQAAVPLLQLPMPPGATNQPDTQSAQQPSAAPNDSPDKPGIIIEVLYSGEKKEWILEAADMFAQQYPHIQVNLSEMPSLQGAIEILHRKIAPTVWIPSDTLVLNYTGDAWREHYGTDLFPRSGAGGPASLVSSPLVWVLWESRLTALRALLEAENSQLEPWRLACDAAGQAKSWSSVLTSLVTTNRDLVVNSAEWGAVKFFHADPLFTDSGMQSLYLLAEEYHAEELQLANLRGSFKDWLKSCETSMGDFPTSAQQLVADMIRFGSARFDIVVVHEYLAIIELGKLDQNMPDKPVLYYPPHLFWSYHPAVVLNLETVSAEQRVAGRTWVDFLRSESVQRAAIKYGFRPVEPSISIVSQVDPNPFRKIAQFGGVFDPKPGLPAPPGPVLRELLMIWSEVTGRF